MRQLVSSLSHIEYQVKNSQEKSYTKKLNQIFTKQSTSILAKLNENAFEVALNSKDYDKSTLEKSHLYLRTLRWKMISCSLEQQNTKPVTMATNCKFIEEPWTSVYNGKYFKEKIAHAYKNGQTYIQKSKFESKCYNNNFGSKNKSITIILSSYFNLAKVALVSEIINTNNKCQVINANDNDKDDKKCNEENDNDDDDIMVDKDDNNDIMVDKPDEKTENNDNDNDDIMVDKDYKKSNEENDNDDIMVDGDEIILLDSDDDDDDDKKSNKQKYNDVIDLTKDESVFIPDVIIKKSYKKKVLNNNAVSAKAAISHGISEAPILREPKSSAESHKPKLAPHLHQPKSSGDSHKPKLPPHERKSHTPKSSGDSHASKYEAITNMKEMNRMINVQKLATNGGNMYWFSAAGPPRYQNSESSGYT